MKEIDQEFVASVPNLLLLRAMTVEERGDRRDTKDFASLLELAVARGLTLRELEDEERSLIVWAAIEMDGKRGGLGDRSKRLDELADHLEEGRWSEGERK